MEAPEIRIATLKSKATRNFNKSATNQKDPGPGDIMMPMRVRNEEISHFVDDLGAPIKCIVTHAYKNYIFGTIINTIPTMKAPKEVCLSDAIEADAWEYDFEICTRAVIEEKSALVLALEEIKYKHKKVKEWKAHLHNIALTFPNNIADYEAVVKQGYVGIWPRQVNPNRNIMYNRWPLNSFLHMQNIKVQDIATQVAKDKYKSNFRHQIGQKVLLLPNQIISFQDWLIQNP
jgi:hypothetical protein